jgi:hypothetical protein
VTECCFSSFSRGRAVSFGVSLASTELQQTGAPSVDADLTLFSHACCCWCRDYCCCFCRKVTPTCASHTFNTPSITCSHVAASTEARTWQQQRRPTGLFQTATHSTQQQVWWSCGCSCWRCVNGICVYFGGGALPDSNSQYAAAGPGILELHLQLLEVRGSVARWQGGDIFCTHVAGTGCWNPVVC